MSLDANFSDGFSKQIDTFHRGPHLSRGLSSHAKCRLQAAMKSWYGVTEFSQGGMAPGTVFHAWVQGKFQSGETYTLGGTRFEVLGHEQYVFYNDIEKGIARRSPIDTLVYNLDARRHEAWDYKTTQKDIKYVYLEPAHAAQANIYAYLFNKGWGLVTGWRVIYINKGNYNDIAVYYGDLDKAMAAESIAMIEAEEMLKSFKPDTVKQPAGYWRRHATGLDEWTRARAPKRAQCRYCEFAGRCKELCGIPAGVNLETDAVPDLPPASTPGVKRGVVGL